MTYNMEHDINVLIATRRSGKAFDPEQQVPAAYLSRILEAARWAPSCYGDQPWRYIVCDRFSDEAAWKLALSCLVDGNQKWAQSAPVLLLTLADTQFSHNGKVNRWAEHDCGAASLSLCLQARELGIMSHQMGGFHEDKIINTFNIPERFKAVTVIALGYQLSPEKVTAEMHDKEFGPRSRKAFADLFFFGKWQGQ